MDKHGVIKLHEACKACKGKGCDVCGHSGRVYPCAVCGKYDCEHVTVKKKEKADGTKPA